MRWWATAAFTGLCACMLLVYWKGFGRDPHEVPWLMRGRAAPAMTLKRIDTGERFSLAALKGKPVVINFWATWCGPCKAEHPVLAWGAREFGSEVQFVGVINGDTAENARTFLSRNGTEFPQLLDENGTTGVDFGLSGVPETYFIDAKGVIQDRYAMALNPQILATKVRALLGPQANEAWK